MNATHKNVKTPTGMVHVGKKGLTWAGTTAFMPACRSGSTALRYGFPTDEAVTCSRCLARLAKEAEYAAIKAARRAAATNPAGGA